MWFYNLVSQINKPFQKTLEYSPEFNPRVHGPYDPSKFYGKADPFGEVKLGQVGEWFGRRQFGLYRFTKVVSRALWRYRLKYVLPKKAGPTAFYHVAFILFVSSYYLLEHPERKHHKWAKYH